jgi:hypothetical protein
MRSGRFLRRERLDLRAGCTQHDCRKRLNGA